MLNKDRLRCFYRNGFEEAPIHGNWPRLWNKHFRIETLNGQFLKLNRFRDRLSFKALQRYCVKYAPAHLYMSVLNWLMPERVGEKPRARHAYPIGGEYVVDIDADTVWRPHSARARREKTCRIEFKENGLEITGPCAQCFSKSFRTLFKASKSMEREISAYMCVNPKTGDVDKVVLGKVGTSTSTSLPHDRICPENQRQVTVHTHPMSSTSKFSKTDAVTITDRMNEGVDDASCIVGEDETQCFLKALISNKRKS